MKCMKDMGKVMAGVSCKCPFLVDYLAATTNIWPKAASNLKKYRPIADS